MDQTVIISSLGDHLDLLSRLVGSAVGLALISGWAGLQRAEKISVLGMEVNRGDAFYLLAAVFIGVNFAATIVFLRVADLLTLVDRNGTEAAISTLALHPWPFNPYAYFGSSPFSTIYSSVGYACLIVIWWIGYSSLALLRDFEDFSSKAVYVVFLGVGLLSMQAIFAVYTAVLDKLPDLPASLQDDIANTAIPRIIATFAGIGIGGIVFALSRTLAAKRKVLWAQ